MMKTALRLYALKTLFRTLICALMCFGFFQIGNSQTAPTAGFTVTDLKPATSVSDDFLISLQSSATGNPTSTNYYIQPPSYPPGIWAQLAAGPNPIDVPLNPYYLVNGPGSYRIWQIVSNSNGVDSTFLDYTISCATMTTPVILTVTSSWSVNSQTGQAEIYGQVVSNDNSQGADIFITDPNGNQTTFAQIFYGTLVATVPGSYQVCAQIWNGTCTYNQPYSCDSSFYVPCVGVPTSGFSFSSTGPNWQQVQFANTSVSNADSNATNWTWTFGDNTTSNAVAPSHTYATTGSYEVCLITTNDCGSDTVCNMVNITLLPAENALGSHLTLSPNPASELVMLRMENYPAGRVQLQLYDQVGKLAKEQELDYTGDILEIPLQISDLKNGVYFLQVIGEGYQHTRKIIRME